MGSPLIRPSGTFSPAGRRGRWTPAPSGRHMAEGESGRPRPDGERDGVRGLRACASQLRSVVASKTGLSGLLRLVTVVVGWRDVQVGDGTNGERGGADRPGGRPLAGDPGGPDRPGAGGRPGGGRRSRGEGCRRDAAAGRRRCGGSRGGFPRAHPGAVDARAGPPPGRGRGRYEDWTPGGDGLARPGCSAAHRLRRPGVRSPADRHEDSICPVFGDARLVGVVHAEGEAGADLRHPGDVRPGDRDGAEWP